MKAYVLAAAAAMMAAPAAADVPDWMSGEWRTSARLTAPDGAQLRIRCTLNAGEGGAGWTGTLGCATVQGRFEGQWNVAISGGSANGQVVFSGPESGQTAVSGPASANAVTLNGDNGQAVTFSPGSNGSIVVDMTALGPQRLSGALTFEAR